MQQWMTELHQLTEEHCQDAINRSHPLADSLVAWYMPIPGFEHGPYMPNLCGNYPLVAGGYNPLLRSSSRKNGIADAVFDGTADYMWAGNIDTGMPRIVTNGSNFSQTLACWYWPSTVNVTKTVASLEVSNSATQKQLALELTTGSRQQLVVVNATATGTRPITIGGWNFGCIVKRRFKGSGTSPDKYDMYWNGAFDLTVNSPITSVGNLIQIGARYNAGTRANFFTGRIGPLMIWNRELSPYEIYLLNELEQKGFPGLLKRIERPTFIFSTGTVFNRSLSDTLSLSESATEVAVWSRSLSDSLSVTEQNVENAVFSRSILDTITLAEFISNYTIISKSVTDSISLSESGTYLGVFSRLLSENITLSEAILLNTILNLALSDTLTVSEQVVVNAIRAILISENISISEVISNPIIRSLFLSDTISITELASYLKILSRSVSDDLTISEVLDFLKEKAKDVSEDITVSEQIDLTKILTRSLSDTITVSEVLSAYKIVTALISDSLTLSDLATFLKVIDKTLTESLTVDEVLSYLHIEQPTTAENINVSELLNVTLIYNRLISDSLTVAEVVAYQAIFVRSLADSITITEAVIGHVIQTISPSSIWILDALNKIAKGHRVSILSSIGLPTKIDTVPVVSKGKKIRYY